MRALMAVASSGLLLLAGCGVATAPVRSAKRSDRLVDFSQKPPYVNALDTAASAGTGTWKTVFRP